MVRITEERILTADGKHFINAYGLSTDTKPTTNIVTGSTFIEVDTADAYLFDEVSSTWIKAGGSAVVDG